MAQAKTAGNSILASDFHDESTGGAGKIPVTKAGGKIDPGFLSSVAKAFVRVFSTSNQTITTTATIVTLDSESFDDDGLFDPVTYTFTAPNDGFYDINFNGAGQPLGSRDDAEAAMIYKNGVEHSRAVHSKPENSTGLAGVAVSDVVQLDAGDTIKIYVICYRSGQMRMNAGSANTYLTIREL